MDDIQSKLFQCIVIIISYLFYKYYEIIHWMRYDNSSKAKIYQFDTDLIFLMLNEKNVLSITM